MPVINYNIESPQQPPRVNTLMRMPSQKNSDQRLDSYNMRTIVEPDNNMFAVVQDHQGFVSNIANNNC